MKKQVIIMKKCFLVLFTLLVSVFGAKVSAQGKYGADSAECIKYLSYYQEYYKQKNYDDALPNWRTAYKLCPPTASQNMLLNGMTLMVKEINKTTDPALRQARVDTILTLNDLRAEYYPKNAVKARNQKGRYIIQFTKDNQTLYDELGKIIEANKEDVEPSILLVNLNAAIELFKDGQKVTAEDVINSYQNAIALMEAGEQTEENLKTKSDIEGLFITSNVASCDNLLALFTPRYEAAPDDIDLIRNIVKMLGSTEGCQDNDLFLNAVTKMHKSEPSAASAYYLYKLHASKDEAETAVKYLEEAIAYPDLDVMTKSDYLLELATYSVKNSMYAKAYSSANSAADLNPTCKGKAYYLIGTVWGSVNCGGNEIESRAKYWVAVDYLQRAKSADESLAEDCNKLIGSYSVYYPQRATAFMYDVLDGQSYTVHCSGMTATTTVRTQK